MLDEGRVHAVLSAGAVLLALAGSPSYAGWLSGIWIRPIAFGEIDVDVAGGDVAGMTAALEEAQNAELKERCELLMAGPAAFCREGPAYCIVLTGRDNEGLTAAGLKRRQRQLQDVQVAPGGAAGGAAAGGALRPRRPPTECRSRRQLQPVSPKPRRRGWTRGQYSRNRDRRTWRRFPLHPQSICGRPNHDGCCWSGAGAATAGDSGSFPSHPW